MIKLVILDLDGPILDGYLKHYQCYRDIVTMFGCSPLPQVQYWDLKRNRVNRVVQLEMINAGHLYDQFFDEWLRRIEMREYLLLDKVQENAVATLSFLKNQSIKNVLITMRNNAENLDWQLKELGIRDFFDDIIAVRTERGVDSKLECAKSVLSKMLPSEALWVGDTEVDVITAQSLNVSVCAVDCGLRTGEYLSSLSPTYLASSIGEIRSIVSKQVEV